MNYFYYSYWLETSCVSLWKQKKYFQILLRGDQLAWHGVERGLSVVTKKLGCWLKIKLWLAQRRCETPCAVSRSVCRSLPSDCWLKTSLRSLFFFSASEFCWQLALRDYLFKTGLEVATVWVYDHDIQSILFHTASLSIRNILCHLFILQKLFTLQAFFSKTHNYTIFKLTQKWVRESSWDHLVYDISASLPKGYHYIIFNELCLHFMIV